MQASETSASSARSLAELLTAHRAEILERWAERVAHPSEVKGPTQGLLFNSIPDFLRRLVRDLREEHDTDTSEQIQPLARLAEEHSEQRARIGASVNRAVWEYLVLRDVILDVIEEAGQSPTIPELRLLLRGVSTGVTEVVAHFSEEQERDLREEKAKLQTIVDHAPAAIYEKDLEGRWTLISREFETIFGRSREELLGRDDRAMIPEDQAAAIHRNDMEVIRAGRPMQFEEQVATAIGSRTFLSVKVPLFDEQGAPRGLCGISVDITERKRLEDERERLLSLLDSQRVLLLEKVLEQLPVGVAIAHALSGRVFLSNAAFSAIWGKPVMGLEVTDFEDYEGFHPDGRRLGLEEWPLSRAALQGETVRGLEIPIRRSDGSRGVTLQSATQVRDPAGEPVAVVVTALDITERKEAEESEALLVKVGSLLSESLEPEAILRALAGLAVNQLCDYCIVDLLGEDGKLHRLAARAREPEKEEAIRRTLAYPPDPHGSSPFAEALRRGEPLLEGNISEAWLVRIARDEQHLEILKSLNPRSAGIFPLIARGRQLGVITLVSFEQGRMTDPKHAAVARAVVERAAIAIDNARLYREAQREAQLREDVLAVVSHDLRNPLNAVTLTAGMLLRREDIDQRTLTAAARIHSAAHRANRLIRDLLDFTQARVRGINLEVRPGDFHATVREVVEEVRSAHPERRIELSGKGPGAGSFDPDRLAQALTNLLVNAVQHSAPESEIRVTSCVVRGELIVDVHNEGEPIPPDAQPALFEPYRRGSEAGEGTGGSLGIGLYIALQIARKHGGTIHVTSTAEEGTTFSLHVPVRS